MKFFSKIKYAALVLIIIIQNSELYSQVINKQYLTTNYLNTIQCQNSPVSQFIQSICNNYYFSNYSPLSGEYEYVRIDSILVLYLSGSKHKLTFTYSNSGKISSYVMSYRNSNYWFNSLRRSFTYDLLGNITSDLHEDWDGSNWVNSIFEQFMYDSSGNNTIRIIKFWRNNNWENGLRIYNTYDSNGNLISSLTEERVDRLWFYSSKSTWDYYPNGLRDSNLFEKWQNDSWEYKFLLVFEYDDEWKPFSVISTIWEVNRWKYYTRITFTYDLTELQISGLFEVWENSQWMDNSRYFYTYNTENYFLRGLYEYWENDKWVPGDGVIHIYNPDRFEAHFLASEVNVYYAEPTSIEEETEINTPKFLLAQNYPNPFNPTTTINYQLPTKGHVTIKVYDMLGKEVAELVNETKEMGIYNVAFNACSYGGSGLSSGVYVYTINVDTLSENGQNYTASKKMLMMK